MKNYWNKILQQWKDIRTSYFCIGHTTSTSVTKRYSKVREEVTAESLNNFFKRVR